MSEQELPWFLGPQGIEAYQNKSHYVVLDFETTILSGFATNPDNHIVLACWYVVKDGTVNQRYIYGDEYQMGPLLEDVAAADFVIAHNAKFEAQWLQRAGADLRSILLYCTQNAEWVLLGNNPGRLGLSLDDVAERRIKHKKQQLGSKLIKTFKVCPSETPKSWLLPYCFKDVELCHEVFLKQCKDIEDRGIWHLILQRNLVAAALADIELQGLQLDKEGVYAEHERLQRNREVAAEQLDTITGGINLNSRPQLARVIYDELGFAEATDANGNLIRTGSGGRSTSEEALGRLVASTPEQAQFLKLFGEYSEANTLLTKTITVFKLICDHYDGKFFGSLVQGRTATGRLASAGMEMTFPGSKKVYRLQLQNIPRQYKRLFTCHDIDYVNMEADGAQLEFRVGAELGNDKQALEDIVNGADIHSDTARVYMRAGHPDYAGLDPDDPKDVKKARQQSKARTFAPMYGGRGQHKAENDYADYWKKKYPDLYEEQTSWTLIVADQKQWTSRYGLTFYWPDVKMYASGYVNKTTEIFNYAIQGFATAEIVPIALVFYWHRTKHLRLNIWNTIHDSIVARVHKDDIQEAELLAKQALTTDVYSFLDAVYHLKFTVPLGVGIKSARLWSTSEVEKVWDVWPSGQERYQEKT